VPVLDRNLFDTLNYLTSDILLPVVGVGIAIFVGWVAPSATPATEFKSAIVQRVWLFLIRFVAPAVVALVLFDAIA
jgi:NSS family neurotransmitter:Na+ symporter